MVLKYRKDLFSKRLLKLISVSDLQGPGYGILPTNQSYKNESNLWLARTVWIIFVYIWKPHRINNRIYFLLIAGSFRVSIFITGGGIFGCHVLFHLSYFANNQ